MMSTPQQLFDEYVQLRKNGVDAPSVLKQLRGRIELLPASERAAIVKQVKVWEAQQPTKITTGHIKPISLNTKSNSTEAKKVVQPFVTAAPPQSAAIIDTQEEKSLPDLAALSEPIPPVAGSTAPAVRRIACPNCGKMNDDKEVMCYSCGHLLQPQNSPFATVPLSAGDKTTPDDSYFGPDATLVLHLRGTTKTFRIQPQKQEHEIIVGRSDGSTMQPDVDLVDQGAGQLGVSRLHVAIQYSGKQNTVSISDLNSANGTYVNGQRLHPNEVRVLRHSDELRLGRMVFQALFHNQEAKESRK